nr:DUF4381 domain-containing protein [Shewanella sp. NIFS-20-20]
MASLHDIQLPADVSAWPLALGYWLLLAIALILVVSTLAWWRQSRRAKVARQQALLLLAQLDLNSPDYPHQVNILLKRAAMSYYPRHSLSNLSDSAWFTWLDLDMPNQYQGQWPLLLGQRFRPTGITLVQKQQLTQLSQHWLKHALPPSRQQRQRRSEC